MLTSKKLHSQYCGEGFTKFIFHFCVDNIINKGFFGHCFWISNISKYCENKETSISVQFLRMFGIKKRAKTHWLFFTNYYGLK